MSQRGVAPLAGAWIEIRPACTTPPPPWSPPSREAWIEISFQFTRSARAASSPPSRGAWIEITRDAFPIPVPPSPPSWGAWIEIPPLLAGSVLWLVAPLVGGVD